ncbi:MAG: DUF2726 domain-containing protein, partial [Neptuniibacter sp.]
SISSVGELGFRKKKTLFTEAERSFLGVLDQIIDPTQHRVFGKVRVADLIEPNPTKNRSEWQKAYNSISAKHFDYVICAAGTLQPACVIELDDKSHSQKKRQQRDELLESICREVELPLVRVPAQRTYKPKVIKALLDKRMSVSRTATPEKERFAASTATPASGENVASQLLGKDKNEMERETESLKVENIQLGEIGEAVK